MPFVREHEARAAGPNDRGDLRRLVGRVERHRDRADAKHAEVGRAPPRVVIGENRDAVAGADAARGQPRARALGGDPELPIRDALDAIAALHLDRDVIPERRRGPIEQVEEGIDAGIIATPRRKGGKRLLRALCILCVLCVSRACL
jgi:hypothetical protein